MTHYLDNFLQQYPPKFCEKYTAKEAAVHLNGKVCCIFAKTSTLTMLSHNDGGLHALAMNALMKIKPNMATKIMSAPPYVYHCQTIKFFYWLVSRINTCSHVVSNLWVVTVLSKIRRTRHYYMRVITDDACLPNIL